jgi:hypothetical protein
MGIFDGVLGGQGGIAAASNLHEDELERQHLAMQANLYSQQLAQSMMNTKQATLMGAYAKQAAIKPFDPNAQEAYKIPLSNLVTLWQAKHGDEWVQTSEEEFWHDAAYRLKEAGKFEVAKGTWYRIKEDA